MLGLNQAAGGKQQNERKRSLNGWIVCTSKEILWFVLTPSLSMLSLTLGLDQGIALLLVGASKFLITWMNSAERGIKVSNLMFSRTMVRLSVLILSPSRRYRQSCAHLKSIIAVLINSHAKSGERGSAARAEQVLSIMEKRCRDGDTDFKPNTRTMTSVIDAWAKSGEKGAAQRSYQILHSMITRFEATGDTDSKPNVHTANAVCNACAFSKHDEDRVEALQIAFRVFDWLSAQEDMKPDSYTYTILLSVCANLIPRQDALSRYTHARAFFERCRDTGYVNDYVLRKLRQTVTEEEFLGLIEYRTDVSASAMPHSWCRNARLNGPSKNHHYHSRKGKWHGRRRG